MLDQIKRKVNPGGGRGGGVAQFVPSIKNEKVTEVLTEVTALKERQEDIDSKLENMRSENDALWGEVMSLRQKHSQQQKDEPSRQVLSRAQQIRGVVSASQLILLTKQATIGWTFEAWKERQHSKPSS